MNYGFYTLYSMCEGSSDDLKDQIILLIWNKYGSSVVILELDLVIYVTHHMKRTRTFDASRTQLFF